MPKSTVSIADSMLVVPSNLIFSTETRRKVIALAAVAGALVATNVAVLLVLLFRTPQTSGSAPQSVPMGGRDIACVQVLRNGGVPEDCSRMYHLDFYP